MCPVIEVSASTYARLQDRATPFVDNPESVIVKLLDATESMAERPRAPGPTADTKIFTPSNPPDLTHTRVLQGTIGGKPVPKGQCHWNGILDTMILLASTKVESLETVRRIVSINTVSGRKETEGYRFLPDAGISVQGQDANAAWGAIFQIATRLTIRVEIVFQWRLKDKAAFPGETGRMVAG